MKKILIAIIAVMSLYSARADEGMWLLSLLNKNYAEMQQLGLKLSVEDIYSVNKPGIKDAIVGMGKEGRPFRHFCSGEIVSPNGLFVTNHHCGFSAIQQHSSVQHNYLQDGFFAYKMEDELTNQGVTASILERMEDVTDKFTCLSDTMTQMQREMAIDSISNIIISEATKDTKYTGQVISMFEGNQFFLFIYTIYKDVRLVAAPPQSMGKFGGDTDNWMWPRHTADFSMFRIYTAPDGSPASYAAENVPLKPKHYLPVSAKGVKEGDFAMILGFPGSTDRFATSFSVKNTIDIENRIRYEVRTEILRIMDEGMKKDEKTRIQYASKHASCANYWKYSNQQNIALAKLNTIANKEAIEAQFSSWLNADDTRKAVYGNVLNDLKNGNKDIFDLYTASAYLNEALTGPETGLFAYRINRIAEKICDKETEQKDKDKLTEQLKNMGAEFYKDFNPDIEQGFYASVLPMYIKGVKSDYYPGYLDKTNKKYKGDFNKFAAYVRAKSIFMDENKFNEFIQKPDMKTLANDPAFLLGAAIYEVAFKFQALAGDLSEKLDRSNRLFVRGLMEMNPEKAWAPNANSTLRLTYGKVGSYVPKDAVFYNFYTTIDGVIEKEGPAGGEFEVPTRLKKLYAAKDFGQYTNAKGELCVNFITDNDITGGNSGSPVINANGELIGTAFDGNSEAMSGDIDFEENLQRCINLDTRYLLWILDKYAGAQNLINEMTIVK